MSIATERAALFGQGLDIVTRETWQAQQSYTSPRAVLKARWLFLHVAVINPSGDEARDMRTIEAIGQARFKIGCSYNAAAFRSGRLYEAQPLLRRGAHTVNDKPNRSFPTGSLNHLARALVLPQDVDDEVTDQQIDAAARWGAALIRAGFAYEGAEWFGHRDVTAKSCPGPKGYARLPELNRLTRHYERVGLDAGHVTEPSEEDDVPVIIWCIDPKDPSRKHAYLKVGLHAKHLSPSGLAEVKALGVQQWPAVVGSVGQSTAIIVDGPCQNVG